jgi:hypothetical protein
MFSKMRDKITIETVSTERTETGGLKESGYTELFTDWCELIPASGTKRIEYRQLGYNKPYDVRLSNRPDVTPENWAETHRAKINGEVYQILSAYTSQDNMKIIMEVAAR